MLCLAALVVFSLFTGSYAACSSSYGAPYDLSATASTLTTPSIVFPDGTYYIAPCSQVDITLCPYTSGQQQCFAKMSWELVADGLGAPDASTWTSYNGDWTKGAVSVNTDIASDYDQCNADGSANVQITYLCNKGDDSITVDQEPTADKNGQCIFKFTVDSAIVCAGGSGGGGGDSTGGGPRAPSSSAGGGGSGGGDDAKSGLSGGWIFVIILLVVFSVYLFGGLAWNHFRGGKTGKEMIPNRDFWSSLPGLVKDGCVYFVGKCRGLCSGGAVSSSSYATM